jgi:membrane associated rhomboid family serine protease
MRNELRVAVQNFMPVLFFVVVLWMVHLYQWYYGVSFAQFGLYPRTVTGLKGIILMPFLHGDFKHLISNSLPLLILGTGITYFYPTLYKKVIVWIILAGGFWLWLGGRPSYHIGASGLVYGLSSFLFFSGFLRRDLRLMALSLLVVFLYGGMVWGIFPLVKEISWEGHLFGGLAGALMAWVYRKEGPQRKEYLWEDDGDEDDGYWNLPSGGEQPPQQRITYIYRQKPPKEKDNEDNNEQN